MKSSKYDCKGGPGFGCFLLVCLIGWCLADLGGNGTPYNDKYWEMQEASWKMEQNMRDAQRAQEKETYERHRKWDDERMKRDEEHRKEISKIEDQTRAMMRASTMMMIQKQLEIARKMSERSYPYEK